MTFPFYKLQIAGNGFVLIDMAHVHTDDPARPLASDTPIDGESAFARDRLSEYARRLCDRRFGVGASGAIFLYPNNKLRIYGARGNQVAFGDDAILCASRYVFDAGRVANKKISFSLPSGERSVSVLGAHEFKLNVGSPFSFLTGQVITAESSGIVESIERDSIRVSCAAIHVHQDVVVAFPEGLGRLDFTSFNDCIQKAFPDRLVTPVIAHCITKNVLASQTFVKRDSGACAVAAASLAVACASGQCEKDAVVFLERAKTAVDSPDDAIAKDRDNSHRLAVLWDTAENDLYVVGTGGYLFEGKIDISLEY